MIVSEKSHENYTISFYSKQDFKLIQNRFFRVKKLEIQVIVFMIMLTRSSERIFYPMRYTGNDWLLLSVTCRRYHQFIGILQENVLRLSSHQAAFTYRLQYTA